MNRALYAVLAVAAIFATLLLLPWPSSSPPPPRSTTPASRPIDEPPRPASPTTPSPLSEAPVARQRVEVPDPPTGSAPASTEPTGRLVLRGVVAIWGEAKPYPPMRVRASDVETGETLFEGVSSPDGAYVLSREMPLSRAPFEALVEAQGEGLIQAIWSRAGLEVERIPMEGQVFPLFLHRPLEVRGTVSDLATGSPIAGALVSQAWSEERTRFGPRVRTGKGPGRLWTTTDESGRFRRLVPDALRKGNLIVEADGYIPNLVTWEGEAPPERVEVRLARTVECPAIRGRVFEGDSRPAAGVRVRAESMERGARVPGPVGQTQTGYAAFLGATQPGGLTTTADEEGRFLLPVPHFGRWRLFARLGESGLATAEVDVMGPGEHPCEMLPASDAVVFLGSVRVRGGGQVVPGATVWTELPSPEDCEDLDFRGATVRTDEAGRFRLGPTPRREYRLLVRAMGFGTVAPQVNPERSGTEQPVSIEVDPECRVRGRLVDGSGRPFGRASLFVSGGKAPERGRADDLGRFALGGLPANEDLEFGALAFHVPEGVTRQVPYRSDPIRFRFSSPGEERDLGNVVLGRR